MRRPCACSHTGLPVRGDNMKTRARQRWCTRLLSCCQPGRGARFGPLATATRTGRTLPARMPHYRQPRAGRRDYSAGLAANRGYRWARIAGPAAGPGMAVRPRARTDAASDIHRANAQRSFQPDATPRQPTRRWTILRRPAEPTQSGAVGRADDQGLLTITARPRALARFSSAKLPLPRLC
jgi:hypothetical protein